METHSLEMQLRRSRIVKKLGLTAEWGLFLFQNCIQSAKSTLNVVGYREIGSTDEKILPVKSCVGSKKTPLCYSKVNMVDLRFFNERIWIWILRKIE